MAVHVLYNNTLKFYQSILMHQNMVQYQLDPTEQKNRPQLNPWSACYWKITNGHFLCIWNIKGTGLQAVWKKIDRSGPPSPKFSNHLTQSWTQFLKRKVHKVEVKTQTWDRVLTWGNLVAARPASFFSASSRPQEPTPK